MTTEQRPSGREMADKPREFWIETHEILKEYPRDGKSAWPQVYETNVGEREGLCVHVIEYSAYLHYATLARKQLTEIASLKAKLEEMLSYLPKVPTQPYEQELARKLATARAYLEEIAHARCAWQLSQSIARKALEQIK